MIPATSTATIEPSQYRIRRWVIGRGYSHGGVSLVESLDPPSRNRFRQALLGPFFAKPS
jgi:hypothetical protein